MYQVIKLTEEIKALRSLTKMIRTKVLRIDPRTASGDKASHEEDR